MKKQEMKIKEDYDKENDILSLNWGEVENSVEMFDGQLILDIDKKDTIVGIEIFNFMEEIEKHNKKMDKLFKLGEKKK